MAAAATDEQKAVVEAAQPGATVLVQAFAGTGKTTTLRMVAEAQPPGTRVIYVCFGKQTEQRFGGGRSTTFDALCFHRFGEHRPPSPINKWTVRNELGIDDETEAGIVADRLNRYAVDVGAPALEPGSLEAEMWDRVAPGGSGSFSCFARLRRAFFDAGSWSLGYDVLLVDECQDLNPAMLESLLLFSGGTKVFVGDRFQHIFGFLGTVDAFGRLESEPGVHKLGLTRSFRFGPEIARLASDIANATFGPSSQPSVSIEGTGGPGVVHDDAIETKKRDGPPVPMAILAVKNATLLRLAFDAASANRPAPKLFFLGREAFFDLIDAEYERFLSDGPTVTQRRMVGAQLTEDADKAGALQAILRYGTELPDKLRKVRGACAEREDDADLILCTIHKSKGLEWDRVGLLDDLDVGARGKEKNARELIEAMNEKNRLYYVGVTRAKKEVWFPQSLRAEFRLQPASRQRGSTAALRRYATARKVVSVDD